MTRSLRDAQAVAVVDLGFGDAGKGLMVDALVRRLEAKLVVRCNGGAQAGHNVVVVGEDGTKRHHTFAQLGAGSFVPNVRTHLAADVVIHPTALLVEAKHLEDEGIANPLARVSIDPNARVITPVQQAAGRLRELVRGAGRHGSCGVGVGECVRDSLVGRVLRARDLGRPDLARFVLKQQKHKWIEMAAILKELRRRAGSREADAAVASAEMRFLEEREPIDRWAARANELASKITFAGEEAIADTLTRGERIVFEGAQGVLLDETYGFHPHTTWSRCTFAPAQEIAARHSFDLFRLGVVRMYAVRHGAGPLPSADAALEVIPEAHNANSPWQGAVRRGWPDPVLLRYALAATEGADALAVTHLDALPRVREWQAVTGYRLADGTRIDALPTAREPSLEAQETLGRTLTEARASYESQAWGKTDDVRRSFADWTGLPVALASTGPTAGDVSTT